jgi:hypothetical protein
VQKLLSDLARDPGSGKFKDLQQQRDDQQRQGESFSSWGWALSALILESSLT